jgi:hypothetical protein
VKFTADQNKVNSGTDLTNDANFQLMYNTTINYDAQFQLKKAVHLLAFTHDIIDYDDEQAIIPYEGDYDIHKTTNLVLANQQPRDS